MKLKSETRIEREEREAAERRQAYLDARPRPVTPPPGPGRRPDEIDRHAKQRQAQVDAAEAKRRERQQRASEAFEQRKADYAALVTYRAALGNAVGQAKFDLEQATARYDVDAALEAGTRLVALERAQDALKRFEARIEAANLGRFGPVVSVGLV